MRARPLVFLSLLLLLGVRPAFAQQADPEKLFAEGTTLIDQGKYAEALPKLEEAQRLDPGIGTQFNIAVCHEKLGRLATAWRNFEAVAQLARASGKKQREQAARAKLEELAPRVPAFVIRSDEPGDVTVKVDGVFVSPREREFWPVDPGEHVIDASAATKKPWSVHLATPGPGEKLQVVVPRLAQVEGTTRLVTVTKETTDTRRTLGFIFGGVGVAGVAVATVTGVMLLGAKSTADQHCAPRCVDAAGNYDQQGADAVNRGKTLLPINAVAWGVAAIGIGAGAFFILTSGKKGTTAIAPVLTPTTAALGAQGTF